MPDYWPMVWTTSTTTTANSFQHLTNTATAATLTVNDFRIQYNGTSATTWTWPSDEVVYNYPIRRITEPRRWAIPIPLSVSAEYISENHPDPDSTIEIATVERETNVYRITASGGRFEGCETVRVAEVTVEATIRGFMEAGRTRDAAFTAALELYVHALFASDVALREQANAMLDEMTAEGQRFQHPDDLEALFNVQREERRAAIARHREETERQAEIFERQAEERRAAVVRADALLESVLTAHQRRMLRKDGHFFLTGSKGNRYQICRGLAGNVYRIERGKRTVQLCGHAPSSLPDSDTMVAQKLMLETDEDRFLALANHTPVRSGW